MKQEISIEKIKIKPILMSSHQKVLRQHLLFSSYWNKKQTRLFLFLKGGEEIITMKKFLSVGFVAIVMIIAALFVVFSPLSHNNTQQAYAEQIAQKSSQAVSQLTPSQLQALKQKLPTNIDPDELLQEAKNAKDLKILTYDQLTSEYSQQMHFSTNGSLPLPSGAPSPEIMDMHNLTFLQFTDTNGDKIVLGIDENNLPVFAFGTGKDGGNFGMVRTAINPEAKGQIKTQVAVSINGNGPVIMVNGKQYAVPTGVTLGPNNPPPSIQTKDGEVYVNGVKATPIN